VRNGLLDYVGELWREFGDVFQVRIGSRTLTFLFHPDAVEHVTVEEGASTTKPKPTPRSERS
jgi:hypothetical protein